jgi:hypothetical protein
MEPSRLIAGNAGPVLSANSRGSFPDPSANDHLRPDPRTDKARCAPAPTGPQAVEVFR